jgi:carboxypeptidase family protein
MLKHFAFLLGALVPLTVPAYAQSPNNAGIVVIASDQSGGVVGGATVSVRNDLTGAVRDATTGNDGSASFPALSLTGTYTVTVTKTGFGAETRGGIGLRSGETATLKVTLLVGAATAEVIVYGSGQGVRADAQIGVSLNSTAIDETPILGRKVTTLPLLNSAFRQGKGTGDLFVNATYFITGSGSRRTTTYMLDGASNDEGWGRQTMLTTVPLGAVQEAAVLTNAFSAEFGWTAGPAMNIVTKSGTNSLRGEGIYLARPGGMQAKTFSTKGYCPPSVSTCTTPSTLVAINAADLPDELNQVSASIGGRVARDKTFFFASADYTHQAARRQSGIRRPLPPEAPECQSGSQAVGRADPHGARELRSLLRHQPERRRGWHERAHSRASLHARFAFDRRQSHHRRQLDTVERSSLRLPPWRSGHVVGSAGSIDDLHASGIRALHHWRVACRRHYRPPAATGRHHVMVARTP